MDPNYQLAIVFVIGLTLAWGMWYIPGLGKMTRAKGIGAVVVAAIFTAIYKFAIHDWAVKQGWVTDN